jgi:lipopolysaccharide transport system permease protein
VIQSNAASIRQTLPRRVTILRPPSAASFRLFSHIKQLLHYKDLFYTLSVHRIKVRYKQSVLGISWAILQPLSMMLIFTIIFSVFAKMPSEGAPYALFAYVALLPWTFFSTSLANATSGLVSHTQLVTKVYFPREILPLTYIVAALFDFLIASSVLIALMFYYRVPLTLNALFTIPIILVLTCFATAMALFFSATQVRYRDIGVAIPLLLQLWMFATPVVYPLSAVPAQVRSFYILNPMVGIIENFRQTLLNRASPDFSLLGWSALISLILLVVAYLYFKRLEATMADII